MSTDTSTDIDAVEDSLADSVWMTTEDVAKYAQRAIVTIHRHAAAGTLRSTSGGRGRRRRYHRTWVDAWITEAPRLPPAIPAQRTG